MQSSRLSLSSQHSALLGWLRGFPQPQPLDSLDLITQSPLLAQVLTLIDSELFSHLQPSSLTLLETSIHLARYMATKLGFKGIVTGYCDGVHKVMAQLLYVSVHCDKKQKFISGILKLEPETQSVLMKIISRTSKELESYKEMKEVMDKVEELEGENEELGRWILTGEEAMRKIEGKNEQLKRQLASLETECETYRKEKSEVLKELNITQLGDYLELYRRLTAQFDDLEGNFKRLTQLHINLQAENNEYKKKIIEDSQFIYILSNESDQARSKYQILKSVYANSPSEDIKVEDLKNTFKSLTLKPQRVLQESSSENICVRKEEKRIQVQELVGSVVQVKSQNLKLFEESRELESECGKLRSQVGQLRAANAKLSGDKTYLVKKVWQLQDVYKVIKSHCV